MDNNQTIDFIDLLKTLQVHKEHHRAGYFANGYIDTYYYIYRSKRDVVSYQIYKYCECIRSGYGCGPDTEPGEYRDYSNDETQYAAKELEYRLTCNIIKEKIRNTPIGSKNLHDLGEKKTALLKYKDSKLDGFNYQDFVTYEEMIAEIENAKDAVKAYFAEIEEKRRRKEQKRLNKENREEQKRLNKENREEQKKLNKENREEQRKLNKEKADKIRRGIFNAFANAYAPIKSKKDAIIRKITIRDTRDL